MEGEESGLSQSVMDLIFLAYLKRFMKVDLGLEIKRT